MFNGSYIKVILDIAETDPRCKLSFVKSDIENARKELAKLQSAKQTTRKRRAKGDKFDPRDVSILGGDPSL